jgi:PAS domain S-box-containing protein
VELLDDGVDCIVSDYEMPETDGIEFLETVREEHPELPFILFTGQGSEAIASDAISSGVTDYLQKGRGTEQFTLLANRIENAVEATRSKRQLAERTRRLETLIDNLPGMVYRCRNEPGWPMENVEGEVEELTGYTAESLERGDIIWGEDVLHPDEREEIWERVQSELDNHGAFELTYRITTRDGELKWMWERGRLVDAGQRRASEYTWESAASQLQGVFEETLGVG